MIDMILGFGIVSLAIGQIGLWLAVMQGKGRR